MDGDGHADICLGVTVRVRVRDRVRDRVLDAGGRADISSCRRAPDGGGGGAIGVAARTWLGLG